MINDYHLSNGGSQILKLAHGNHPVHGFCDFQTIYKNDYE